MELIALQLRDFVPEKGPGFSYKGVDDTPYGGGPGMIMRADVLKEALIKGVVEKYSYPLDSWREHLCVFYPSPIGPRFTQKMAKKLAFDFFSPSGESSRKDLVFICGRYEGIDQRFIDLYIDEEISLGDFVLSGGEPATLAILDALLRLTPGALGNSQSIEEESFSGEDFFLEHPQYTRPSLFEGLEVPTVLTSGDHQKIKDWKKAHRRYPVKGEQ